VTEISDWPAAALPLDGSEIILVDQGGKHTKSVSLLALAQMPFAATGASAVRSAKDRAADVRNLADFGAHLDGVTDDSAAVLAAASALGTNGGVITWRGNLLIDTNLTLPDGVSLVGGRINPGQFSAATYDASHYPSTLTINGAATVTLGRQCTVKSALVIRKGLSLPFPDTATATAGVAAFAGTAFTAGGHDNRLEDLLILGFGAAYSCNGFQRPYCHRVYLDCTNGLLFSNVNDIGKAIDCHAWPFTTTNQGGLTTDALLQRTGTAFQNSGTATWFKFDRCFSYGWGTGFDVGCSNTQAINCGADDDNAVVGQNNIGFWVHGAIHGVYLIACQSPAHGNAGFLIDTGTDALGADVHLIGCSAWDFPGTGVTITTGNVLIDGCSFKGGTGSHISFGASAGIVTIKNCTFASIGTAIGGNAAAMAKAIYGNNTFIGVTTPGLTGDAFASANGRNLRVTDNGTTSNNRVVIKSNNAGNDAIIATEGDSDTNISLIALPAGTGLFKSGSRANATAAAGAATANGQRCQITSESLTTAAGSDYVLTLGNTFVVSTSSQVFASVANGTNTTEGVAVNRVQPSSGQVVIRVRNTHASAALNGTLVINVLVVG
jgi:hypothetical protein